VNRVLYLLFILDLKMENCTKNSMSNMLHEMEIEIKTYLT